MKGCIKMYVVATCGVFIVGTQCNASINFDALENIRKEFAKHCQTIFCLREDEVKDVKVEYTRDTDSIVTALPLMDKFTDTCSKVIRKKMTNALKDSIFNVYTKVYEREMKRKVDALRNSLSIY